MSDEWKRELAKMRLGEKGSQGICPHCGGDYLCMSYHGCHVCSYCEKRCNADKSVRECEKCLHCGSIDIENKCGYCGHVQGNPLPPRCKACNELFGIYHCPAVKIKHVGYAPEYTSYDLWYCGKCRHAYFKDTLEALNPRRDLFDNRIMLDVNDNRLDHDAAQKLVDQQWDCIQKQESDRRKGRYGKE